MVSAGDVVDRPAAQPPVPAAAIPIPDEPVARGRQPRTRQSRVRWRRPALVAGGSIALLVLGVAALAVTAGPGPAASPQVPPTGPTIVLTAAGATPIATYPGLTFPAFDSPAPSFAPSSAPPTPSATASVVPSPSPSPTGEPGVSAKRIRIPSVGIDIPVVQGDGVDAPIGKAAHFPGTGWPGGGTNIYLYGHAREGMFIGLWNIEVGASIELDLVSGAKAMYTVTKIVPSVPPDAIQYTYPTATEQLTLQTCTGYLDSTPRFIVIAVPAS